MYVESEDWLPYEACERINSICHEVYKTLPLVSSSHDIPYVNKDISYLAGVAWVKI